MAMVVNAIIATNGAIIFIDIINVSSITSANMVIVTNAFIIAINNNINVINTNKANACISINELFLSHFLGRFMDGFAKLETRTQR